MKLLEEGAEARIYSEDGKVIKERIPKTYRIPEIDDRLRKFRTRREVKIIDALSKLGAPVPKLISFSDKTMKIEMELIEGKRLRDVLSGQNSKEFGNEIGNIIALLHKNDIIHSDLTTSNILVRNNRLFLIDFGLSFISVKPEDKAVDLHLLRQALESSHHLIWKDCFDSAIESYKKNNPASAAVLERLESVEQRGRNKAKEA